MALQGLIFIIGIILVIVGVVKRHSPKGRWMLASGVVCVLMAIVLVGYGDVKMGFMDALKD